VFLPRKTGNTLVFSGDFRFHLNGVFALAPEFSYWKKPQSSLSVTSSSTPGIAATSNVAATSPPSAAFMPPR